MGLPEDDPAVARGCLTLMAPICILIVGDRRMMKRALPSFGLGCRGCSGTGPAYGRLCTRRPGSDRSEGAERESNHRSCESRKAETSRSVILYVSICGSH